MSVSGSDYVVPAEQNHEQDELGVVAVDAAAVEQGVVRNELNKQSGNAADTGAKKVTAKDVTSEIKAVTALLRAQNEAAPDDELRRPIERQLLQQRLAGLHAKLSELRANDNEDAWSSDASEAEAAGAAAEQTTGSAAASKHKQKDAPLTGALVETDREKQVRLGLITPFQGVSGFSRSVNRTGPATAAPVLRPASLSAASRQKSKLEETARKLQRAREGEQQAATKLISHEAFGSEDELDTGERPAFFRGPRRRGDATVAAEVDKVAKRQRKNTLPRGPRVKRRRAVTAAADEHADEHADSGEDLQDFSSESDSEGGVVHVDKEQDEFDDADTDWYEERVAMLDEMDAPTGNQAVRDAVVDSRENSRQNSRAASPQPRPAQSGASPGQAAVEAGVEGRPSTSAEAPLADGAEEVAFDGGFQIPARVFDRLFPYQQVGVQWLWELHTQRAGGVMSDDMGLGKTVQLAVFLAGLLHSGLYKPSMIVAPVTTLKHWQRELRTWCPLLRLILLHSSVRSARGARPSTEVLVRKAIKSKHGMIVTSYEQLRKHADLLLAVNWGYVVLDEGHRIRNPDADITLVCKQVKTVHRVILSGTPIQNRLTELWSLFDFVFPGKLGTLPVFQAQFGTPIQVGSYSNASAFAVTSAYKCAVMLRDMISPYLLRRAKVDVAKQLPQKTEQVLFCSLSKLQRKQYLAYISSRDVADMLEGRRAIMEGITVLRKICNHADLVDRVQLHENPDVEYGALERSAKLQITMRVLEKWKEQGHKALLFTQTQQMLDIIERHVDEAGFGYHRMDGSVAVAQRYRLIDDFNDNPDIFVFLLTTRVGGIGVNLTGADRILLFDPDWNPSSDAQARERAWRLGQKRPVTIFRLITRGTIEEKVYHRQIYKQALSTRILSDPRQRRYVASRDVRDLFTLTDRRHAGTSETGRIFSDVGEELTAADLGAAAHGASLEDVAATGHTSGPAGGAPGAEQRNRERGADTANAPGSSVAAQGQDNGRSSSATVASTSRQATGQAGASGAQRNGNGSAEAENDGGDSVILKELFEGAGLHSALNHSAIESASGPARREAEAQAAKVAERAAAALRQSRKEIMQRPVHIPTWTGRAGHAGAPEAPKQRFGSASRASAAPAAVSSAASVWAGVLAHPGGHAPAAADIIARHRQRSQQAQQHALQTQGPGENDAQALMAKLIAFLEGCEGHAATSTAVLEEFDAESRKVGSAMFKQTLRQVAVLRKRGGTGYWSLKADFQ